LNQRSWSEWKTKSREQFVELLKEENTRFVLELGAGAGIDAEYFIEQGLDVLATDFSEEMVKSIQSRGIEAQVLDLYDIQELGRTFNGVYAQNVLLHVPRKDLQNVLSSVHGILNAGGVFFIGVYSKGIDEEQTFVDEEKMGMPRFFSFLSDDSLLGEVKNMFKVIEFETIKKEGKDFYAQSLFLRKI